MAGLWQLLILGCACHFLCVPGVSGAKFLGTPKQCDEAEFVPGHNLAGEGLDIVKMERKGVYVVNLNDWRTGNGTCTLMKNKYLSKLQKLPVGMKHWRCIPKCNMKVTSKKYESSESLVEDATSSVSNDWKVGLNILGTAGVSIGGTHSREATFSSTKSKQDKYSFTSHQVQCSFYRYDLASTSPNLHKAFVESLKTLPKRYTPETRPAYMDLIKEYGTHYITKVKLGGRMKDITAIKGCQSAMKGLTDTAVQDCLYVEASATYKKTVTISAEARRCSKIRKQMRTSESFSSMFNERQSEVVGGKVEVGDLLFSNDKKAHQDWKTSLMTVPDIVSYSAKPLFFLMSQRDPARAGLKKEIRQYIMKNALVTKCSGSCRVGRRSRRDSCSCACHANSQMTANCCPTKPGLATLKVYSLYARKLYGDRTTQTDGSVRVSFGGQIRRTSVIWNKDNPYWYETFNFGRVQIGISKRLYFEVYDADSRWNSDFLGMCIVTLRQGTVSDSCMLQYGTFFFSYRVICAPSLGGDYCHQYIPSPVSPLLAKSLHSRNGVLAGEQWEALLAGNDTGFEDCVGE